MTDSSRRTDVSSKNGTALSNWSMRRGYVRFLVTAVLLVPAFFVDEAVTRWAAQSPVLEEKFPTSFRHSAQQFGEMSGIVLIVIALALTDRPARRPLVFAAICATLVGGVTVGLKLVLGRERPNVSQGATVFHGPVRPGVMRPDPSFPSGHTSAAFAFAFCLSRLYPRGTRAVLFLAALCGISRVLSGKHFVSDIVAGAWVGWETAGILWTSKLWGLVRVVDDLIPDWSMYPAWNWERDEPIRSIPPGAT